LLEEVKQLAAGFLATEVETYVLIGGARVRRVKVNCSNGELRKQGQQPAS